VKTYVVKNIFGPTVQGEGSLTGQPTVFVRFGGCNVWDGRAETKAASACPYCDTDFRGGERMSGDEILLRVRRLMRVGLVTFSGGEPLLQLDAPLVRLFEHVGYRCAVETNGTIALSDELRATSLHVTCSPKVPRESMRLTSCDDLKVLVPHPDARITPDAFASFPARARWVQPVNGEKYVEPANVERALRELFRLNAAHGATSRWGLSVQLHKLIGVE
jgi:7-carboxy-7-deazaguanine synthase